MVLTRLVASYGGAAFFSVDELRQWPKAALVSLKKSGLLTQATPANSVTCDGCEERCHMTVDVISGAGRSAAFVMCDKSRDIGRVDVPLDRLERWQASGEALAALLARLLNIHRPPGASTQAKRWPVGILRDIRAANVELDGASVLVLELAGHRAPLSDVLTLKGRTLAVDRQRLVECVNHPVAGGGTGGSAAQRRTRIAARCKELFQQGHRNFRRIVAKEEGCSVETIKDVLAKAGFSTRGLPRPTKVS